MTTATAREHGPSGSTATALLDDPARNKGTAFTKAERQEYGLNGLLPEEVEDIDRQVVRVLDHLKHILSDLDRYVYLIGLVDRNETLFYKVVMSDPGRFIPILYDPTVAEACLKFGHIYRRPRGMYISLSHKGHVAELLRNWPVHDVRFICVSTGGRILGLGDLGANGMGIPIGKLQLYTACAGVPPKCLLPVLLDIGTTNTALLADPLYLGLRQEPPATEALDEFVEEFVQAVQKVFPGSCIHFEDWKGTDAIRLLAKYAGRVLCYNDDIQGTAAVVLAGLTTALEILKQKFSDQRILFFGAGSAAIGIANLVVSALAQNGITRAQATSRIWMCDIKGLIESSRKDLSPSQAVFAAPHGASADLVSVIKAMKPTMLIGVSTKGGAFNQQVVETMSKINHDPVIFALSNPTENAECTAEQAYTWSKGRALFAGGVQFSDVKVAGKTFHPGQANNFYIFPALGLAVYATKAKRITDEAFIAAAKGCAAQMTQADRDKGMLFPSQTDILKTEIATAASIATFFFDHNLASVARPANVAAWIEGLVYKPEYASIRS
jgi:malate dehydrogenase (oxaloacetate-decarboxylating)(NADP+)